MFLIAGGLYKLVCISYKRNGSLFSTHEDNKSIYFKSVWFIRVTQ